MDNRLIELSNSLRQGEKEYNELLKEVRHELKIDIYNLEDNCATHPEVYFKVAVIASKAGLIQNRSELIVKELKAEIATDIRSDPEKYGITKITEGQIFEGVDSAEYAKEARKVRASCMHLKNNADALLQAFEHRRSMLNNEVQLFLSKLGTTNANVKTKSIEERLGEKKRVRRLHE